MPGLPRERAVLRESRSGDVEGSTAHNRPRNDKSTIKSCKGVGLCAQLVSVTVSFIVTEHVYQNDRVRVLSCECGLRLPWTNNKVLSRGLHAF